ncbi:hypothetical protein B9T21_09655 [Wohlfahrtiimonas chitiniclastica]|uniref:hypothetical protein n=1 Tax=Wohlfahrtiimonas chitiniclastica TaxID=400946 RepID=UPI000B99797A|nr:hypothetical protein [Wohlfahrtiimonas chitiniclastica]OYQ73231.1 hypothetical protein B9T18_10115 [Wohlfahrtiimonas chitiniclastica]OYQ85877.1 hypothetical protein B9T21_09655 [Wohlfahrtiimonas chitiniclastica]
MAIVSISEASRLTGKTRATIHRHINTGKLSKAKDDTGIVGIDISELIRVYNVKIDGSVALRNSKPVFQLGLSISQPKSKRLPQDPNRMVHLFVISII